MYALSIIHFFEISGNTYTNKQYTITDIVFFKILDRDGVNFFMQIFMARIYLMLRRALDQEIIVIKSKYA